MAVLADGFLYEYRPGRSRIVALVSVPLLAVNPGFGHNNGRENLLLLSFPLSFGLTRKVKFSD